MDPGIIIGGIFAFGVFILFPLAFLIESISLKKPSQRETDKKVEEATVKSEEIVAQAQAKAEKILQEATAKAEKCKAYSDGTQMRLEIYIKEKCNAYPQLAAIMADLLTAHYEKSAKLLENKKNPALKEAVRIRDLKKETQKVIKESKELEYKLAYIEALFPNISDIFEKDFNTDDSFELESKEDTDRVRLFLSSDEYHSLSTIQKNQLALNRYLEGRKSNWQIGRDYEMYIGYLAESLGYTVTYTGIIEKLEDMGRDLILKKNKQTYIVQCKNWSKEKTIHEKHIFQLFGTITLYNIDHPKTPAKGVFVSTTQLSEKAQKVADELNIMFVHKEMGEFPRIKCNINKTTQEKIYHLPFDQQYDSTVISKRSGEFYAFSVQEAEDAGFRRAQKHFVSH